MKAFLKSHRKLLLGVLVVLVLVGVWVWFAGQARQQASFHRTDDRVGQAKKIVAKAYKGSRTDRMKAIGSLADMEKGDTCRGDWWNDWQQTVVPGIKGGAKRCHDKEKVLAAVTAAANAIQCHITDEAKLTKVVDGLVIDTSAKDWPSKAKTAAQTGLTAIDGIRVVSTVEPVQTAAKARIEAIISAWNSLDAASAKQDKTAYLAAETQLKQAYADLAAIADVSDAQLQKVLSVLSTASKSL